MFFFYFINIFRGEITARCTTHKYEYNLETKKWVVQENGNGKMKNLFWLKWELKAFFHHLHFVCSISHNKLQMEIIKIRLYSINLVYAYIVHTHLCHFHFSYICLELLYIFFHCFFSCKNVLFCKCYDKNVTVKLEKHIKINSFCVFSYVYRKIWNPNPNKRKDFQWTYT